MFKVNNEDTRATSLTSFWGLYVNFEHISQLFLVTYDQHFLTCLSDWYWDSCWKLEVKWTYFQSVLLNINIEIIYLVRTQNFLKD